MGDSCQSNTNACGQYNTGYIQCNGVCSAKTPALPAGYGTACTSAPNACGQTGSGTINCSGTCSASTPANPSYYGTSCTSAPNACGQTNTGTYNCSDVCSASAPSNSNCTYTVSTSAGAGGAISPSSRSVSYGSTATFTVTPNAGYAASAAGCGGSLSGTTYTTGAITGACTVTASFTAMLPSTPTVSALWQGSTFIGTTASAYNPSGYQLEANATSPSGANLDYYFEWSSDTASPQWSGWVGSGGWGSVTHYAAYPAGTYYARAWAYDANGNWSASPSAWLPITLATPALAASCSGSPGSVYINQPVTWSSAVSGGSGSWAYSWSGTDGLSGTTSSVQQSYSTTGTKQATLTVTDINSGQQTSATCTNSVQVTTCTASLTATPSTVDQGQNTSLSWSVSGGSLCASSCTGSGFTTGGAISGTANASVVPAPPSTSYALTCTGGTYGPPPPVNATVTVVVPSATITANNQPVSARVRATTPNNTTVAWSSANSTSCAITRNGAAWKSGLSSVGVVDSVTNQTVYKIDCVNSRGTHATNSVLVNIEPILQQF